MQKIKERKLEVNFKFLSNFIKKKNHISKKKISKNCTLSYFRIIEEGMKKSQKFYYKKKSLAYIACEWRVLITKDLIDASIE